MDEKPNAGKGTNGGKELDKPTKAPRRNPWRRFIRYELRKVHKRKAEREKKEAEEGPEQRSARITARATWHIALLTYVLAAVAVLTLIELIRGGADTKSLVKASQQQACAAKNFASSADKINHGVGNAVTKLGQQADDAEAFFRTDERSWVVINSIEKTLTIPPDPPFGTIFKFSIFPKNVGKTVARNVRIHTDNLISSGAFMENQHAILMSQDQLFRISGTKKRAVTPDNPGPQTLAPGAQSPVPIFSGGQEPKRYSDGNFTYNYIVGRIDYTDAFDTDHWTHFCYFIANSRGDLANCKYGNDLDSNPEKVPPKPN